MRISFLVYGLFLSFFPVFVHGQAAPLWHGLDPGPYSVGFKMVWKYDYSRTWQPDSDFEGKPLGVESARPIRIKVWYPAAKQQAAPRMDFEGYLHVGVPDKRFAEFNKRVEEYDLKSVRNFFKSGELFSKLLKTQMAAVLDAAPVRGKFPLVVFSVGQNDHTLENIVLWEYLASHGYVVATVPHLGTSTRRFQLLVHDQTFYEAQVRDLEFVIQEMRNFPNADAEKLAMMGHSFGGIYALLTAMRNSKVDAVVGLDPTFVSSVPAFYYKYWEAPNYDPRNLRVPMLVLYKGVESESLRWNIVDDLKFSDRYLINFHHLVHGDFQSVPMIVKMAPEGEDFADREYALKFRTPDEGVQGHKLVCRYTLDFLNGVFKNDKFALAKIKGAGNPADFVTPEFKAGLKAPSEEDLYEIISSRGIDEAIKIYRAARSAYPNEEIIREPVIRRIGNEATYNNDFAKAVDVFRLYAEAYPNSADAYDRLGDAYLSQGNKEQAATNFKKSLDLNPQNQNAKDQLEKLKKP